MTFLNFTKVTPAAPNDPLVNEVTHLNNNWDNLETKLTQLMNAAQTFDGSGVTQLETGMEYMDGFTAFRVWTGSFPRIADDIDSGWSAWQNLPLNTANMNVRTGFQPKWRNNSLLRKVQLSGGIRRDASGTAWPASNIVITTGTSGIPSTMAPIGGTTFQTSAAALPTTTTGGAYGWHQIDVSGSWVRITSRYGGGPGGGNFVMLEGVEWWY